MIDLLAVLSLCPCLLGWPKRNHSPKVVIAFLALAIGAGAGLVVALSMASKMPRGPSDLTHGDELFQVLAVTEDAALIQSSPNLFLRVHLSDLSIEQFSFEGDFSFVGQTAAHDGHFAFTSRPSDSRGQASYIALLGPGGFVVPPGEILAAPDHAFAVTLSPDTHEFRLFDTAFDSSTASVYTLERDGTLIAREPLVMCAEAEATSACFSGGELYLIGSGRGMRFAGAGAQCEPLRTESMVCPGASDWVHVPFEVLGPDTTFPLPDFAVGHTLSQIYTVFDDRVPSLRTYWITPDLRNEVDLGEGNSLRIDGVSETEALAFGFAGDAAYFARFRDGTPEAQAFVARWSFPAVSVVPHGDSLILIDQSMTHYVRLDAKTLERRDLPGALPFLRARLAVWGGASWLFEALVVIALAMLVLMWPVLVVSRGEKLTRQRVLSIACAVLSVAALMTWKRLFRL